MLETERGANVVIRPQGYGMLLSFLVGAKLLPLLRVVNGADIVDISAFKLQRAHLPIIRNWCACGSSLVSLCDSGLENRFVDTRRGR
jgi:hypothetical protein